MPFMTGAIFIAPLAAMTWLLNQTPPPSALDHAARAERRPMTQLERRAFLQRFMPGLTLLVAAYLLLTVLRDLRDKPLWIAILASWGISFLEYCVQVPANRKGYGMLSLQQLKILQEIVTLGVFAVFSVAYMGEKLTWNYAAACGCMIAAAWFMFRV
jgi:uncharacterized protein (DUF486 family)